jgi:hypothetical protein
LETRFNTLPSESSIECDFSHGKYGRGERRQKYSGEYDPTVFFFSTV